MIAPLLLATQMVLWHAYSTGAGEEVALSAVVRSWNAAQARLPEAQRVPLLAVGIPNEVLSTKLKAAIPRGHGPDVFIAPHNFVAEWSRYGVLQPLDELLGPAVLPALLPETVEPLRLGGKLYGLPLAFKSLALFYRTDLLPTAPGTTDDLIAACRRVREASGGTRYGLAYESGNFFFHAAWLHGFGGSMYPRPDGPPRLDTPEERAALDFVQGLARRRDIPDEMTGVLVTQFFNQGRAAAVINGPWFIGQIEPGVPYALAPLPRMSPTGRPSASLTTVEAGFVNPHGAQPAAAARFLTYLVGPEAARVRAKVGRQLVTTRATWDEPEIASDPVLAAFYAGHESLVPTVTRAETNLLWEPMAQALRQVLRGAKSPAAALAEAQHTLEIYLQPLPPRAGYGPYGVLLFGVVLLLVSGVLYRLRQGLIPRMWRERWAYAYLAPAAISMALLVFVPFAVGAGMSMFVVDPEGRWRFVGLANFSSILLCRETPIFDPLSFYYTLPVTVLWTVLNVSLHVLIGGTLAFLLRDPWLRMRGVYRMLLLIPWAVPNYITALIWRAMFNRQFGAINGILVWLGLSPVSWFSRFWTALIANVTTNVWLGFPFMMVVTLGALAQLPREVEEAALLDGATRWQRLRHVVLPLLWPQLLPSILLGSVWTFNMFNIVFLVSGGEPDGATEILVSQAYRWAFTRGHRYGYAAAYAVLIFVVLIFQTALMRRYTDRGEGR